MVPVRIERDQNVVNRPRSLRQADNLRRSTFETLRRVLQPLNVQPPANLNRIRRMGSVGRHEKVEEADIDQVNGQENRAGPGRPPCELRQKGQGGKQ